MTLDQDDIRAIAQAVKAELVKELFGAKLPDRKGPNGKRLLPFNQAEFQTLVRKMERTNARADKRAVEQYIATHEARG